MTARELIHYLSMVPPFSEVIFSCNGHYGHTDTQSHGQSQIYYVTMGPDDAPCVAMSSDRFFNAGKMNFSNLKVVAHLRGPENKENGYP